MEADQELSIVIPAHDAAPFLRSSLSAVRDQFPEVPVVVVDSGSNDDTGAVAAGLGARVVRLPARQGPAGARNAGVAAVQSDIVLFLDADCVPHPDVVDRVLRAFRESGDLVALCGSYDDEPPERNFFSSYMNLRHHHTHQRSRRETGTFWAGCGAVRRQAFLEAGGFDAARYPTPMIEDIELATRLQPLGRLRLDPELQVSHLKRWTFASVVRTDVWQRAVPWARLVAGGAGLPDDLNLRWSQRVAAVLAPLVLIAPLAAAALALSGRVGLAALALLPVVASLVLHADMLRCFARARGHGFAIGAWAFHQLHLVYAACTFVLIVAWVRVRDR